MLLDRVRNNNRERTVDQPGPGLIPVYWFGGSSDDMEKLVRAAFARIPAGVHIRFKDFLTYESREQNALRKSRGRRSYAFSIGGRYINNSSDKDLERAWSDTLTMAVSRLLALGAVEFGALQEGGGRTLTVALTAAGQYLLGLAPAFTVKPEPQGVIVVQPNFDIVFMAPSPIAEAELGSFTERLGKHVGVVLRITKKSVWTAASAGIGPDHAIDLLRKHSSAPLPANVDREIRGWMGQCKRATVRQAVLIECPDEETATRVAAVDRARLSKLSSTIVELADAKERAKVARKLREIGVFV
jgi:hypothetical protein